MGRFATLMTLDIYRSVLRACPVLMRPIIRILLKAGVNYKQFAKLTRDVYVEVATEDFGISGRKTNTSRVAILTGISRSEVTKIKKKQEENGEIEIPQTVNNASRLLSGWHTDQEYLNEEDNPKALEIESTGPCFKTLMNKYGGDIPLTAMLKELKQVGCVKELSDGKVVAIQRYFMPQNYDENRIFTLADTFVDIGETSYYNFTRDINTESRFQGRVFNNYINKMAIPAFKKLVESKGQKLFEEMDEWLALHEITDSDKGTSVPIRLGLGMYLIQDELNNMTNTNSK